MFFFFGLIPSFPPVMFNKEMVPGTRHFYTLHVEATQNGIMLIVIALMLPYLRLNSLLKFILEVSINIGAWMNVIPWVYGGLTGAVLILGEGQRSGNYEANPPPNNDILAGNMGLMLMACGIGDVIGWIIVLIGCLGAAVGEKEQNKKSN